MWSNVEEVKEATVQGQAVRFKLLTVAEAVGLMGSAPPDGVEAVNWLCETMGGRVGDEKEWATAEQLQQMPISFVRAVFDEFAVINGISDGEPGKNGSTASTGNS